MASHSSVLIRKIPLTEEPGELWCVGLQRVPQTGATGRACMHNTYLSCNCNFVLLTAFVQSPSHLTFGSHKSDPFFMFVCF